MHDPNSRQGPGRPSKFDERLGEKIVELFEKGKTFRQVCDLVGIHPKTLRIWMKNKAHLRASIKEAKLTADELVETSLFQMAMDGDTTAAIFWLKNRQPERWRDKRDLNITSDNRLEKMKDDELLKEKSRFDQIAETFMKRLEGNLARDVTPTEGSDSGDPDSNGT